LEYGDDVKVMAHEKRLGKVSNQPRRWRRHWNEVQEDIRTEHNEDQSEENASNDGGDFHSKTMACSSANSNLEVTRKENCSTIADANFEELPVDC